MTDEYQSANGQKVSKKKSYVIGNWKSYKRFQEAKRWLDIFAELYQAAEGVEIILSPTFLCLEQVGEYLEEINLQNVSLAAQDISPYPKGAYTGAVAADLLKGLVDYVIVGHPERRRYFKETSNDIGNKVHEAVDSGIVPIVCIDQPYSMSQLTPLNDMDTDDIIIAYGSVDALTKRIAQEPDKVVEAVKFITEVHPKWPVTYGGAISPENAGNYAGLPCLTGLFCGSGSLDPKEFHGIFQAVAEAHKQVGEE